MRHLMPASVDAIPQGSGMMRRCSTVTRCHSAEGRRCGAHLPQLFRFFVFPQIATPR